jgi:GTP-binding protein EngB required for normal cell division
MLVHAATLFTYSFIVIGPSQTGKSMFVNSIAGKKIAKVGDGSGTSVTEDYKRYQIDYSPVLDDSVVLIDMQGFDDSRLHSSNEEIVEKIQAAILEGEEKINGIIVTESISGDSIHLLRTLDKIYTICGDSIKKSIIILATKGDLTHIFPEKYENIKKIGEKRGIPVVKWSNKQEKLTKSDLKGQFKDFLAAIKNISDFNPDWIKEFYLDIYRIAENLANKKSKPSKEMIENLARNMSEGAEFIAKDTLENSEKMIQTVETEITETRRANGLIGAILDLLGLNTSTQKITKIKNLPSPKSIRTQEVIKQPFEKFLKAAADQLEKSIVESFLPEAKRIKLEELKKKLLMTNKKNDL